MLKYDIFYKRKKRGKITVTLQWASRSEAFGLVDRIAAELGGNFLHPNNFAAYSQDDASRVEAAYSRLPDPAEIRTEIEKYLRTLQESRLDVKREESADHEIQL